MWNAVIVDRDYGSVSLENQEYIKQQYANNGINLRLAHYRTPEEILENCKDADAILGTGNPPITKEVLEGLPNLKVVQRFGIGVNSIDLKAATDAGVLILYMPGFCVQELAVHAAALILNLLRNISFYDRRIRMGQWPKAEGYVPRNPKDLVLGLYGFGGSARPLYDIFYHGFGTKVITCDPYVKKNIKENYDVEIVSFDQLLKRSDIISIHAPLTKETYHIFNRDAFIKMKSDAMIVNISRGGLIDQEALTWAIDTGEIRFAGLDVFEEEPLPVTDPLIRSEQAALTCHSAFYGDHAQQNQLRLSIDLVNSVLNKKCVKKAYIANQDVTSKIEGFQAIE